LTWPPLSSSVATDADASLIMLSGASGQVPTYSVAGPNDSPSIVTLRHKLDSGGAAAVKNFWDAVHKSGAPLIEAAPGANGFSLVTFLWQGNDQTRNVVIFDGVAVMRSPDANQTPQANSSNEPVLLSTFRKWEREQTIAACKRLTDKIKKGLDLSDEMRAALAQRTGDVVLTHSRSVLDGFAVCLIGPGSEGGEKTCYVKFGAARGGAGGGTRFDTLLAACGSHQRPPVTAIRKMTKAALHQVIGSKRSDSLIIREEIRDGRCQRVPAITAAKAHRRKLRLHHSSSYLRVIDLTILHANATRKIPAIAPALSGSNFTCSHWSYICAG
jgi:hypothetical protein